MAFVLDPPKAADGGEPLRRRPSGGRGDPEHGLGSPLEQACRGTAGPDRAVEAQHGVQQTVPRRAAEPRLGGKHFQFSHLPAISADGPVLGELDWTPPLRTEFETPTQLGLIVLDLRGQMIATGNHLLKSSFCACAASSVNTQSFSPSASMS